MAHGNASDAWVRMGIRVYIYSTSMTFYLETRRVGHRPKNVVLPNPWDHKSWVLLTNLFCYIVSSPQVTLCLAQSMVGSLLHTYIYIYIYIYAHRSPYVLHQRPEGTDSTIEDYTTRHYVINGVAWIGWEGFKVPLRGVTWSSRVSM